jgi:hypothetical protein
VAQGVRPEFKPQYLQKKRETLHIGKRDAPPTARNIARPYKGKAHQQTDTHKVPKLRNPLKVTPRYLRGFKTEKPGKEAPRPEWSKLKNGEEQQIIQGDNQAIHTKVDGPPSEESLLLWV